MITGAAAGLALLAAMVGGLGLVLLAHRSFRAPCGPRASSASSAAPRPAGQPFTPPRRLDLSRTRRAAEAITARVSRPATFMASAPATAAPGWTGPVPKGG